MRNGTLVITVALIIIVYLSSVVFAGDAKDAETMGYALAGMVFCKQKIGGSPLKLATVYDEAGYNAQRKAGSNRAREEFIATNDPAAWCAKHVNVYRNLVHPY